ncbi:type VI secretion system Vgr family protein [Hymenobacter terrenus]|uniref:type VI secretion system Vgr family protein n=1 Tax=Hymenobacter terrenus TaxID=1629124 RepID=UPI00061A092D|nr:contractile injection system protein, VgrG/Pvc8 family [Hymenobacter terrenus]
MARQVTATIECAGKTLVPGADILYAALTQTLFDHHTLSLVVPFDSAEGTKTDFLRKTPARVLGQSISFVVRPDEDFEADKGPGFTFKGIVTEMGTSKESDGANNITVQAYSPSCMLMSGMKKRTFVNQTLAAIFKQVLQEYPENVVTHSIKPRHTAKISYAVQYHETNFGFLSRLASEYGEWFFYDGNTLHLGMANEGDAISFVADGVHNGFHIGLSLHPTKFKIYEYDYLNHQHYTGDTASEKVAFVGQQLFGDLVLAQADNVFPLESHAAAEVNAQSSGQIREEARTFKAQRVASMIAMQGYSDNSALQVGQAIRVSGTGLGSNNDDASDFGTYRIVEVVHRLDTAGNYSNTFTAIPSVHDTPPVNPHHEPPAGMPELAEVIDNEDPKGLGRIRVRYYWPAKNPENAETDLIRVLTPYSGGGKGQLFTPELGSQVLIGYQNGLAEQPFVQGNFFHANNPAGAKYSHSGGKVKGIQTMGGNKITFHDKDGKEKILISNGKKKATKLEISFAKDGAILLQTDGTIILDAKEKISLVSKEIELQAENKIVLESSGTVDVTGTKPVKVSGQTLDLEAQTTASLAGQTGVKVSGLKAELSSSTMTNIKGVMVKVN